MNIRSDVICRIRKSRYERIKEDIKKKTYLVRSVQKKQLSQLSPQRVASAELAGEKIQAILTRAPGNDEPIGGLKVVTQNGWFAARPSGTEDIYKIYAESFLGTDHLRRILAESQIIVSVALATTT